VDLVGLDIEIPPDHDNPTKPSSSSATEGGGDGKRGGDQKAEGEVEREGDRKGGGAREVVIDDLVSTDARLVIIPREQGKNPKVWDIHHLLMHNVGADQAMPYEATLTNAIPPARSSQGDSARRARTPARPARRHVYVRSGGSGVFKGISGILSAHGNFGGVLERIDIHGETETPSSPSRRRTPCLSHEISRHRRRHQWQHDTRTYRRIVSQHVARRQRRVVGRRARKAGRSRLT
jgi:hypothetical protein